MSPCVKSPSSTRTAVPSYWRRLWTNERPSDWRGHYECSPIPPGCGSIGANPNGEACVCDLTISLGLSQPTVSHHLKVLTEAGLLGREQRGRWVFYWLLPEPIELLRSVLAGPVQHIKRSAV
jgi:DNA-binding transcriptional ArsR family regulator